MKRQRAVRNGRKHGHFIAEVRQADSNLELVVAGGYLQYLSEIKVTVHVPSRAENIEYSCVITPDTVCVSNILCDPLWVSNEARWYVNVNGGSPYRTR